MEGINATIQVIKLRAANEDGDGQTKATMWLSNSRYDFRKSRQSSSFATALTLWPCLVWFPFLSCRCCCFECDPWFSGSSSVVDEQWNRNQIMGNYGHVSRQLTTSPGGKWSAVRKIRRRRRRFVKKYLTYHNSPLSDLSDYLPPLVSHYCNLRIITRRCMSPSLANKEYSLFPPPLKF